MTKCDCIEGKTGHTPLSMVSTNLGTRHPVIALEHRASVGNTVSRQVVFQSHNGVGVPFARDHRRSSRPVWQTEVRMMTSSMYGTIIIFFIMICDLWVQLWG